MEHSEKRTNSSFEHTKQRIFHLRMLITLETKLAGGFKFRFKRLEMSSSFFCKYQIYHLDLMEHSQKWKNSSFELTKQGIFHLRMLITLETKLAGGIKFSSEDWKWVLVSFAQSPI